MISRCFPSDRQRRSPHSHTHTSTQTHTHTPLRTQARSVLGDPAQWQQAAESKADAADKPEQKAERGKPDKEKEKGEKREPEEKKQREKDKERERVAKKPMKLPDELKCHFLELQTLLHKPPPLGPSYNPTSLNFLSLFLTVRFRAVWFSLLCVVYCCSLSLLPVLIISLWSFCSSFAQVWV